MNDFGPSPVQADKPGFWHTTSGLVTGITGLLGSLGTLIGTLAAVGAFSSGTAAGADSASSPPATAAVVDVATSGSRDTSLAPSSGTGYPPALVSSFVGECSQQPGASQQYRQCGLDNAEAEWAYDEFVRRLSATPMDPALELVVQDCANRNS